MRTKDEEKQVALFEATIKTVNEMGFVAASVSKIAKEANVSPATLYVYHDDKEALLVNTYIEIKKSLSQAILRDFDPNLPIRDILLNVWLTTSDYISKNKEHIRFSEQFANSPYSDLVNKEMVEEYFNPLINVLQRGIDQKIIKNVDIDILVVFIFRPVVVLSNPNMCCDFESTPDNIKAAFTLAWDAIKL